MAEETLSGITLIDPKEASVIPCNVVVRAEGHPSMVMHRQALLVMEDSSGRKYVVPMSAIGAAQVARDMQRAAEEAANEPDEEELEEVEISFSGRGEEA